MRGEGTCSKKRRQNGSGCRRDQHLWQQQVTHSEGMLSIPVWRWDTPRWMHFVDHRGRESQIFLLKSPSKREAGVLREPMDGAGCLQHWDHSWDAVTAGKGQHQSRTETSCCPTELPAALGAPGAPHSLWPNKQTALGSSRNQLPYPTYLISSNINAGIPSKLDPGLFTKYRLPFS